MCKTTSEDEIQRHIASWSGRAVGREVGMGKDHQRLGIIRVWRHEDRGGRLSRQGLVPVHME